MLVLEGSFCGGPAWRWNLFDTLLVALSITEMIMHGFDFHPSVIRVLRVVRLFRSLRVLRLMRFAHLVRKLRMMSLAMLNCTVTLMWAVPGPDHSYFCLLRYFPGCRGPIRLRRWS